MLRVVLLMTLASLIWVPIGVMAGAAPGLGAPGPSRSRMFLAAFPANLLYPPFVVVIVPVRV